MCRQQYVSMLLWTFGLKEDSVTGESPPLSTFAPLWFHPLEYLDETISRMMRDVTTGHIHRLTDAGESDPYVPLCFAGDTKKERPHSKWSLPIKKTFFEALLDSFLSCPGSAAGRIW